MKFSQLRIYDSTPVLKDAVFGSRIRPGHAKRITGMPVIQWYICLLTKDNRVKINKIMDFLSDDVFDMFKVYKN